MQRNNGASIFGRLPSVAGFPPKIVEVGLGTAAVVDPPKILAVGVTAAAGEGVKAAPPKIDEEAV